MPRLPLPIELASYLLLLAVTATGQTGPASLANPAPKTAEQAYKNIQVLKSSPAEELLPAMQFIAASLGVECDFCHVQRAFEKDDKAPKQKAREMMQMMFAINQQNFEGHREVTCYSCHRGSAMPIAIPEVAQSDSHMAPVSAGGNEAVPANLPSAKQVVDKYVQTLGGAEAVQKVSSRVGKGTATVDAESSPFELFAKAPDKRIAIMHLPKGDSFTAYDGQSGWLGSPGRPVRELAGADLEAIRLDADFYFPVHITQIFKDLRMSKPEKVGGQNTYVLLGMRGAQPPVKLYFDEQSGLLVRLVRYSESPLGRLPTEIDYADYRDAGGAKVPYRWTIARPTGRFTIQIEQMQANVPVDDAKFTKPPASKP